MHVFFRAVISSDKVVSDAEASTISTADERLITTSDREHDTDALERSPCVESALDNDVERMTGRRESPVSSLTDRPEKLVEEVFRLTAELTGPSPKEQLPHLSGELVTRVDSEHEASAAEALMALSATFLCSQSSVDHTDTGVSDVASSSEREVESKDKSDSQGPGLRSGVQSEEGADGEPADELATCESLLSKEDMSDDQLRFDHCYCLPPDESKARESETETAEGANSSATQVDEPAKSLDDDTDSVVKVPTSGAQECASVGDTVPSMNFDHEYTRPRTPPPPIVVKRARGRPKTKMESKVIMSFDQRSDPKDKGTPFPKRNFMEELQILCDFLCTGIDAEDIGHLKRSYEMMLQDDSQSYWLNDTHWVDHPHILFFFYYLRV